MERREEARGRLVAPLLAVLLAAALPATAAPARSVLPADHPGAFFEDAAQLLLAPAERRALASVSPEARRAALDHLLTDPLPETEENELVVGIERRLALVQDEFLTLADARARLLFLRGRPASRVQVECGTAFVPIELWSYPGFDTAVLYQPAGLQSYWLWLPIDSKRALYTPLMASWMETWERLAGAAPQFDRKVCPQTRLVEAATGIRALSGVLGRRPLPSRLRSLLEPPRDLATWAVAAATAEPVEEHAVLATTGMEVHFPDARGGRLVARFLVGIPKAAELGRREDPETGETETALSLDGVVELDGEVFEDFRVRFRRQEVPAEGPIALVFDRALRPDARYVVRVRIEDEATGARAYLARTFDVPRVPEVVAEPPVPDETIVAIEETLDRKRLGGVDSVILMPPPEDAVVLNLWRAAALVSGDRIAKVAFLVDGSVQMVRSQPPYSAEVRLSPFPKEQVVRAEGYDEKDRLVASDEVVVNRPRGALRVRILEPEAGADVHGPTTVRADVVVPTDKQLESVEFRIDDEVVARRTKPPWEARVDVPEGDVTSFLTVVARLEDGTFAEDLLYLSSPRFGAQVEVDLVELLATVTDRSGRLVRDLGRDDFQILEDGRPQKIERFDRVEDLPLNIGITVDTSGSMASALPEARQAALGFLTSVVRPGDKVFAVAFADEPHLVAAPSDDVEAVARALEDLHSVGWTSLHDAVVSSLFYFRGFGGRRALILLSDGDDTASDTAYRDTLEYARRSGVVIYSIGLGGEGFRGTVKKKLAELARETGGRAFFISKAAELVGVYKEIEEELRSQYLLAFLSDRPAGDDEFRPIEVVARGGRLKVRTVRGYYP